jgi:hypothetical protein
MSSGTYQSKACVASLAKPGKARRQKVKGKRELQDLFPNSKQPAGFREGDDRRDRDGIDQQVG